MKKFSFVALFIGIILLIYPVTAQIVQFSGALIAPGTTSAPVVLAQTFNIQQPAAANPNIHITASNNPTSFTITSCPNCTNFFLPDNTGAITITPTGRATIDGSSSPLTYMPVVQATNNAGNGSGTIIINAYSNPAPITQTFNISVPDSARQLGTLSANNGGITQWSKGSCTPGCDGFFGLDNTGAFTLTATGGANIADGTYSQIVTATNVAGGSGSNTITIIASPSTPTTVDAKIFNIPTPAVANDTVGTVTGSVSGSFSVSSCPSCTGFFAVNSGTGVITLTTTGAAAFNGTQSLLTFKPVIQLSAGAASGVAAQTVNGWADGSKGASTCTAQHPTLISGGGYISTPAWRVAGVNYCVGWASAPTQTVTASTTGVTVTTFTAASASLASSGVGWVGGQTGTALGGVNSTPATIQITGINSLTGAVTAISLTGAGSYTTIPSNPVTFAGPGGQGLTANVNWNSSTSTQGSSPGTAPTGCSRNDTTKVVTCSTAGTTVSGWNFGAYAFLCTANNVALTNSTLTDSGNGIPITAGVGCTNFTLTKNLIQGKNNATALVSLSGTNPVVKYNYFKNAHQDLLDIVSTGTTNIRFNLLENLGVGGSWVASSTGTTETVTLDFNSIYQPTPATAVNGLDFTAGSFNGVNEIGYNTIITTSGDGLSSALCIDPTKVVAGASFVTHDNYLDQNGITAMACLGNASAGFSSGFSDGFQ